MSDISTTETQDNMDNNDDIVNPYQELQVEDKSYNMNNLEEVKQAKQVVEERRKQLQNDELTEYENKSTIMGKGGRSQLLYDEKRIQLAEQYHNSKHDMTWEEQNEVAQDTVTVVAAVRRHQGKF